MITNNNKVKKERISADLFVSGLLVALAEKGQSTVTIRDNKFDEVVELLYNDLKSREATSNFSLRFRIVRSKIHGDSKVLRDSITHAAKRDLVSIDNPDFLVIRSKLSKSKATDFLDNLPVSADIFRELASMFIKKYPISI